MVQNKSPVSRRKPPARRTGLCKILFRSCSDPGVHSRVPVAQAGGLGAAVGAWVRGCVGAWVRGCVGVHYCRTYTKAVRGGSEVYVLRAARA